jgi:hypothetical protein
MSVACQVFAFVLLFIHLFALVLAILQAAAAKKALEDESSDVEKMDEIKDESSEKMDE